VLCKAIAAVDGAFTCGGNIPSGTTAGAKGPHQIVAKATPSGLKATTSFCLRCVWGDGDMVTYTQGSWSDYPAAATLLVTNYQAIYAATFGVLEIGIPGAAGFSVTFTGPVPLQDYLPAAGPAGPFDADLNDPMTTSAGVFGGEVAALKLNVDFSDAGVLAGKAALRFADLRLCNVVPAGLSGLTVRQALDAANTALGAGPTPYAISDLDALVAELNGSFGGGNGVSTFAQQHLLNGACP
jgi:hypothetical protein